jgi:hypothetical protein
MKAARLHYVLRELLELEVLVRQPRLGDSERSRYVRHRCVDPLTVFWFRLVQPNRAALLGTTPEQLWRLRIGPRLDDHMGPVFEEIVAQAVRGGMLQEHFGPVDEALAWWSRDWQTELDLIARSGSELLYIECKWRPEGVVTNRDLYRLRGHAERHRQTTGGAEGRLCLVTSGRFAPSLREVAAEEGVILCGPDELLGPGQSGIPAT